MIGKTVSRYHIVDTLGAGGMSVVYKAQDTRLGRFVALKFLLERFCRRRESLEQFEQEARTASALNHPGICTIHDIDQHRDRPFIVMEYLEGETLRGKLRKQRLSIEEAVAYGIDIADALSQAHANGIVHRDISPANVFVTLDGRVKLLDFGISTLVPPEGKAGTPAIKAKIKNQTLTGTIHYMSPEQALGQDVDARSDIFSLGVVLYEMLTGRRPFTADNIPAVVNKIVRTTPDALGVVAPDIPAAIQKAVSKCLEKRPEQRYPSAAELHQDLKSAARALSFPAKNHINAPAGSTFGEKERTMSAAETIHDWRNRTVQIWLDI